MQPLKTLFCIYALAAVIRYGLINSSFKAEIENRVEVSTPINSFARGKRYKATFTFVLRQSVFSCGKLVQGGDRRQSVLQRFAARNPRALVLLQARLDVCAELHRSGVHRQRHPCSSFSVLVCCSVHVSVVHRADEEPELCCFPTQLAGEREGLFVAPSGRCDDLLVQPVQYYQLRRLFHHSVH